MVLYTSFITSLRIQKELHSTAIFILAFIAPVNFSCDRVFTNGASAKTYCLIHSDQERNINEVTLTCLEKGYYLLSIDDEAELDYIRDQTWWSEYSLTRKYWLRLMNINGWVKWLNCKEPSWTNWESEPNNQNGACAYSSRELLHTWKYTDCYTSLSDLIICEKEEDNCPINMIDRVNSREYCYIPHPVMHSQAKDICLKMGYNQLIQFETSEEMMDVFDLYTVKGLSCFSHPFYWLGLKRSMGSWQWESGLDITWSNWQAPPNEGGKDCGAAYLSNDEWQARQCSETHVFLCEKGPEVTIPPIDELTPSTTSTSRTNAVISPSEILQNSASSIASTDIVLTTISSSLSAETTHQDMNIETSSSAVTTVSTTTSESSSPIATTGMVNCPSSISLDRVIFMINSTTVGSFASVSCFPGTEFGGGVRNIKPICRTDGSWDLGQAQGCQDMICPMLDESKHRMVSSQYRTYGHNVSLVCSHGYQFMDGRTVKTIKCGPKGQWEPQPENCTVVTCPPIPVWYGFVTNTTNRSYQTYVRATCRNNDTYASGASSLVSKCKMDGGWTPKFKSCHDNNVEFAPTPKEAPKAYVIGLICSSILAAILTVFIIVDIKLFKVPKLPPPTPKPKIFKRRKRNRVEPFPLENLSNVLQTNDKSEAIKQTALGTKCDIVNELGAEKLPHVPASSVVPDTSYAALL